MNESTSRRSFLRAAGVGAAALGMTAGARAQQPKQQPIQGFEEAATDPNASRDWKPVSDRKIRVGIVGYGVCRFGAAFGFQDHPNVEVVAVSDLFPDRCANLAKACRCEKTYPSLEDARERRFRRGGVLCHRCPQSRAALHRSAASRQTRRLCRARGSRIARGR